MKQGSIFSIVLIFCVSVWTAPGSAQSMHPDITISELVPNLYKFQVRFVNALVLTGPEGMLISDTAYGGAIGEQLNAALESIGAGPVEYILNTHWHGDHTDGNVDLAADRNVMIIAHENVRKTRSEEQVLTVFWQETYEALPDYALPSITFSDRLTLTFNEEVIEMIHLPGGHSDGDAVVYFKNANVVHMGDLLFSDGFPAVDFEHHGHPERWADNLQVIIDTMPEDVLLIAGHGRDYSLDDLREYREMLLGTSSIVKEALEEGMTLAQMNDADLLEDWASWGETMHSCEQWIEILYHCFTYPDGESGTHP